MTTAYQKSGVDVEAGYDAVHRMKRHTERTNRLGVMGALGGFGGCFDLSSFDVKEPVLVSGTDGVGTKLMLAIEANQHDSIGIDCVAMCVNDILAQGAEPLFFLDYIATGKMNPEKIEQIVAGIAEGCVQAGAALIGGETAEMPDMYQPDDYDLAGFSVGLAEKSALITGTNIEVGDVLVGLPSSGVHSNGFSLVRQIFFKDHSFDLSMTLPELEGKSLGDTLLEPTCIYVKGVLPAIKAGLIQGISHITGGGFYENIPRMLPKGLGVHLQLGSWNVPSIFKALEHYGELSQEDLYGTFNMGIGMILVSKPSQINTLQTLLKEQGQESMVIGQVTPLDQEPVILVVEP